METTIEEAAADATMLGGGATERGLLSWLVQGTLVFDVVGDVECSVLMAERERDRGLPERPFG